MFLNPQNVNYLNEDSPSEIPPVIISVYMLPHLEKSKLNLKLTDDACFLDIIPWTLSAPAVRFDVNKYKKRYDYITPKPTNNPICNFLHSYFPPPDRIFIEGSKTEEGVAEAAVSTKQIYKLYTCRPPDDSFIFTGGLGAIPLPLTLRHVYHSNVTECICTFVFVLYSVCRSVSFFRVCTSFDLLRLCYVL